MDLKVMIANGHFSVHGNYFIIAQLDEVVFPQKDRKSYKQRTEVKAQTSNPTFKKNLFSFKGLSYGSRLTLKFGVFKTKLMSDTNDNVDLLNKSVMLGNAAITLTQKMISLLRQEKKIEQNLQILKQDSQQEVGRLSILVKYKSTDFDEQVRDDIYKIKENYFDVFEKDPEIVKLKCDNIKNLLISKQEELNKQMKKLHFIRNAHKSVSYDLGSLRKQRDELEVDNDKLREKVKQYNDIYDIHIHIDMLKQTDQGIDVLKEKYVHLVNKLNFERSVYNELSENYFHIETQIQKTKGVQKEIDLVKKAGEELQFHLKRTRDMLPQVDNLKNTIQTQESIIKNLQGNIQNFLKDQDRVTAKDLKVRVEQLSHDREMLLQKQQQLQLILKAGKGNLDYKEFEKLKNFEHFKEDPQEIQYYTKKNEQLMKEIEVCTAQLEDINAEHQVKMDKLAQNDIMANMDMYDANQIIFEIEKKENQAYQLQEELILSTKRVAQELADLKIKRNLLDNLIDANIGHKDL